MPPHSPLTTAAIAWLHQSFAVEGGGWYEAAGRLWPGSNAGLARIRVAWYASEDASGAQIATADSEELNGAGDAFAAVSSGAIRAPVEARSAQLRIMLRPAGEAPAVLRADDVSFASAAAPQPEPTPAPVEATAEAPSPTPGATPSPQAAAATATATLEPYDVRSASAILLRITELLPDPLQSGADAEYEWIEVGNVGMVPVSLGGLFLADNRARIALPALTLPPAGALVVAGPLAEIGDALALRHSRGLFNGLGNRGDRLALATEDGAIIDALSYGSDDSVDQPPLKAPAPGRSLQRRFDAAGRLAAVCRSPSTPPQDASRRPPRRRPSRRTGRSRQRWPSRRTSRSRHRQPRARWSVPQRARRPRASRRCASSLTTRRIGTARPGSCSWRSPQSPSRPPAPTAPASC